MGHNVCPQRADGLAGGAAGKQSVESLNQNNVLPYSAACVVCQLKPACYEELSEFTLVFMSLLHGNLLCRDNLLDVQALRGSKVLVEHLIQGCQAQVVLNGMVR